MLAAQITTYLSSYLYALREDVHLFTFLAVSTKSERCSFPILTFQWLAQVLLQHFQPVFIELAIFQPLPKHSALGRKCAVDCISKRLSLAHFFTSHKAPPACFEEKGHKQWISLRMVNRKKNTINFQKLGFLICRLVIFRPHTAGLHQVMKTCSVWSKRHDIISKWQS